MNEFIWFWLIVAILLVLGVLLWTVFFKRPAMRKSKTDPLHEILFEEEK